MDAWQMLEDSHRQTLAILDETRDEELNVQPAPGAWSVAQVLEHILLTDQSVIPVFRRALKEPRPFAGGGADVSAAADRSVPRKAPDFVRPGDTPKTRDELREALTEARRTLLESARAVGDLDHLATLGAVVPHPVFGDISLRQWLEFVSYHERRHIEQARETLARVRAAASAE
ncbi:MAG: DinB family protein [Thermoflavifilum sp.]|nr:DinB family protein [Thermoflavifilum sp.]MCL6514822.1 DinB family protein [Alicyclobacillus sp.]